MAAGGSGTTTVQDTLGFINNQDAGVDSITFTNPVNGYAYATVGHLQTDSADLVWLQNQTSANVSGIVQQLQTNAAAIFATVLVQGSDEHR